MNILHSILGVLFVLALALLVSKDRKAIKIRPIIQLLIIEVLLAWFLLASDYGLIIINGISKLFDLFLEFSNIGTKFVFSEQFLKDNFFFAQVLMPIIFMSALIGILKYFKIMNYIINALGYILSKVNGMGKLESFNAISALFFGQEENFVVYKDVIDKISERRLYTLAAMSMSTVSLSILGAYISMLDPKYVLTAIILNIFSTFIVLSLVNPYDHNEELEYNKLQTEKSESSFFQMLTDYIITGFKVAMIVAAMMIGFLALLALLDHIFASILGVSFREILGYIFYPIAWIIGIPSDEALHAGMIMGTKVAANEFPAIDLLKQLSGQLSEHSKAIVTIFLISFANFGSIGIITGSIKALSNKQGNVVAKYGFKLIFGATLVNLLSATIAGLVI